MRTEWTPEQVAGTEEEALLDYHSESRASRVLDLEDQLRELEAEVGAPVMAAYRRKYGV